MSVSRIIKNFILTATICLLFFAGLLYAQTYPAGEVNGDGSVNVSDAVWLINYIFVGGDPPVDMNSADVNNDCKINVSDAVTIISYIFQGGVTELVRGCLHDEVQGTCFMDGQMSADSSYVDFKVIGHNLFITHHWAYYQCCLSYYVEYQLNGNTILAQEIDLGDLCDCYCDFDILKSVFYGLENGQYQVILLGLEGDTLAVASIEVGTNYGLVDYVLGECQISKSGMEDQEIEYIYSGDTLVMHHSNAYYMCGSILQFEFEQNGNSLYFYEIEYVPQFPPPCMCYYDIYITIVGIAPGQYHAGVISVWPQTDTQVLLDERWITLN